MFVASAAHDAARDPGRDPGPRNDRSWWVIAALSVLSAVVLRVIVAQTAIAPRTPWDEIGILQMSRLIAGVDDITPMSGAGYYPGLSFVLAPIWWFTDDPQTGYVAAVVVGNLLALLTIVPLALIARRLGLTTAQSVAAGAIVMCLPARTAVGDFVLAEQLLALAVAGTVAAGFWLWERPTPMRAVVFAAWVFLAYLSHARALSVVVVAAVWLLFLGRRRLLTAITGLLGLAVAYVAVRWIAAQTTQEILIGGFGQQEQFLANLQTTWPALALRVLVSHTWSHLVASMGLVAVGAIAVVLWVVAELRAIRALGPVALLSAIALSGFLVGVLAWTAPDVMLAQDNPRFDAWVYTRYGDPFLMLVVLAALVLIVKVVRLRVLLTATTLAVAVCVVMVAEVAPLLPTWGTDDGPGNTAGVHHWIATWPTGQPFERPLLPTFDNPQRFYVWASLSVVGFLAVAVLLRRYPRALTVLTGASFVVASLYANPDMAREYPAAFENAVERIEATTQSSVDIDVETSCGDSGYRRAQALNWAGYWFAPRHVQLVDSRKDAFDSDVVISCAEWPEAERYGARAVPGAEGYSYQLWILDGPLQTELVRGGMLSPGR